MELRPGCDPLEPRQLTFSLAPRRTRPTARLRCGESSTRRKFSKGYIFIPKRNACSNKPPCSIVSNSFAGLWTDEVFNYRPLNNNNATLIIG